jgi:GT2 family glycosyltransferase
VVDAFESSARIGVAGPSTSCTVGPQTVARAYHCRHFWSDEQIWSFAEQYVAGRANAAPVDRPFVGGFAFFVRRTVWNDLGGFDTNLPDYGNEKEFCRRVLQADLRIVWSTRSYIHHLGKQSYGRVFSRTSIARRSALADAYLARKHGA